jgi:hypothetical protein
MKSDVKHRAIRIWGVPAISAAATILVAATIDRDQNWARLRSLPGSERQRLVENLKKFDLLYTTEKQRAIRELDQKLNELDPERRMRYFAVLRNYHNWLNELPDKKQDELEETPPGERMALVKKLVVDYPVPNMTTPQLLQITDLGDYTPFELASLFKTWQALSPEARIRIGKAANVQKRTQELFDAGDEQKIAREIKPPDFDEEAAVAKFERFPQSKRPALLLGPLKSKAESVRSQIVRRQAINFYFTKPKHAPKAVTEERLGRFLASFPPWLQSSFDQYPPDEARRRLKIVYRLVFPYPDEIKAASRPAVAAPRAPGAPAVGRGAPTGPDGKPRSAPGRAPF